MKYEISRADCKFLKSLTIYLNNEDAERLNLIVDNYIKQREKANKEYSTKIKNKRITDPFYARQKDFVDTRCSTMEKRIRKAIKKDETLHKQLELIDTAYITTFDSYALSVVKKYHYLINVSPNITIGNDNVFKLKKIKWQ